MSWPAPLARSQSRCHAAISAAPCRHLAAAGLVMRQRRRSSGAGIAWSRPWPSAALHSRLKSRVPAALHLFVLFKSVAGFTRPQPESEARRGRAKRANLLITHFRTHHGNDCLSHARPPRKRRFLGWLFGRRCGLVFYVCPWRCGLVHGAPAELEKAHRSGLKKVNPASAANRPGFVARTNRSSRSGTNYRRDSV